MTEIQAIENKCEHCARVFVREGSLFKHICEQKRRWLDKDKIANRIGYAAWKFFFQRHYPSRKTIEYKDFSKSNYFTAFVKFGSYCSDISAVNPAAYSQHLIKNNVPIDDWCSDRTYTKYIIDYLKDEDPYDAVKRTLTLLMDVSQEQNLKLSDSFRYVNSNKLCYLIAGGKISPWVIYQSKTGQEFLSNLNSTQTEMIFDYIHPERWNIKFKRENETVNDIKKLLGGVPL
jgi:hypothetical protein